MRPGADTTALAALCLGALLIGFAPIFVRLSDVGPVATAFWRCALAWPLLALLTRREAAAGTRRGTKPDSLQPALLIGAGLFFAIDISLWHVAIGMTTVANATLLANLVPLFVAPAAWLLWRERISARFGVGLALALGGAAILASEGLALDRTRVVGDALAALSAAFYAGYLLAVAQLRRAQSALRVMSWVSATVAVVLLPTALLLGESVLPGDARGWAVLVALALLSHVGGQGLITRALATLPASFSAVTLLIQPLAAAAFAWLLLGERFGAHQALGGAVILCGILLCRRASAPPAAN